MEERAAIKKPFPKQPENKPKGICCVSLLSNQGTRLMEAKGVEAARV